MTVEQRLEQVDQRIRRTNKRLTVALTMMAMVAITIQLSACGNDCNVSDVGALAGRDLSECDLVDANLEGAINTPYELSAKQEEDACRSNCG